MPVITERRSFNGFDVKVERLGLTGLIDEVEEAVTSFELLVHEEKYANGTKWIRQKIDEGFDAKADHTDVGRSPKIHYLLTVIPTPSAAFFSSSSNRNARSRLSSDPPAISRNTVSA